MGRTAHDTPACDVRVRLSPPTRGEPRGQRRRHVTRCHTGTADGRRRPADAMHAATVIKSIKALAAALERQMTIIPGTMFLW
jgi:hypothetical protein